jgi:hypothetical protein
MRGSERTKFRQVIAFISSDVSPAPGEMSFSSGLVRPKVKVAQAGALRSSFGEAFPVETLLGETWSVIVNGGHRYILQALPLH